MNSFSPEQIFSAAERAYNEGRLQEARSHLLGLERAKLQHPAIHHLRALVEQDLGHLDKARLAFEAALQLAPNDAQITHGLGKLLAQLGDEDGALVAHERALVLAPDFWDAAFNRAISLYRLERYTEARSTLQALIARDHEKVTVWNLLGYLERDAGDAAAAAGAFDQALKLQPGDLTALKGRARLALERAEPDVLQRYANALRAMPGDAQLTLEQTEAKLAQGDVSAIEDFAATARRLPEWSEGQIGLGRMLWETRRDDGFADHIRLLLRREPGRLDLWRQLIDLLAGCTRYEAAANAARDARDAAGAGAGQVFTLLEAVHAGRGGDLARADALFALLPSHFPGRAIHESIHHIRLQELELARLSIETALAEAPSDIGSWAVAELIYRKLDDPRSLWLAGQEGLVRISELPFDSAPLEAIKALLLQVHLSGVQMVDQSVREGTQTRWRLFDRLEPQLKELRRAFEAMIVDYVEGLPPVDERHPLLRHRNRPLQITGSWSVRLTGSGGHHISHIHPLGLISSACYFVVPERGLARGEGHLELGRPPADLMLDLDPLHVIEPKEGRLVLFPSYLHHGTRPFASGERISVAFDVNPSA